MSRRIVWLTMFIMCIIFPLFLGLTLSSPSYAQDGIATQSPTLTDCVSPAPLATRQPSLEQMNTFLYHQFGCEFEFATELDEWIVLDMTGDGENDLIVSGTDFPHLYALIFVWDGDYYLPPFQAGNFATDIRTPASYTYFEDWTNDHVPEMIFNYRSVGGGSGFYEYERTRTVIHCQNDGCQIVWAAPYAFFSEINPVGVWLSETHIEQTVVNAVPTIYTQQEGFSVFHMHQLKPYPVWVGPITRQQYEWDGTEFSLIQTEEIRPEFGRDSDQLMTAQRDDGSLASIEYSATGAQPECVLTLDHNVLNTFSCLPAFVKVEWRDVDQDGVEELVVVALSGQNREARCMHQYLTIYELVNDEVVNIADIRGCIVQSDLHGVRFEDLDGDGQVEVIAAESLLDIHLPDDVECQGMSCWFELNHRDVIYRYDGTQFVQAETIPRDPR